MRTEFLSIFFSPEAPTSARQAEAIPVRSRQLLKSFFLSNYIYLVYSIEDIQLDKAQKNT
jgi:hypothetical protein